jgi:hypothetical protein
MPLTTHRHSCNSRSSRNGRNSALMAVAALAAFTCAGCGSSSNGHAPAAPTSSTHATAPPTASPSATTIPKPAMSAQTVDGYTIDVPTGWIESTTNYGGSTTYFTFTGGDGRESVKASLDFCTGCIQSATGINSSPDTVPYLQEMAGGQGSTNVVYASPLRATFDFAVGDGLLGYGVEVINSAETTAIQVRATVLTADAGLGQAIAGSVKQSS